MSQQSTSEIVNNLIYPSKVDYSGEELKIIFVKYVTTEKKIKFYMIWEKKSLVIKIFCNE